MDGARAELYINTGNQEKSKRIFSELKAKLDTLDRSFADKFDWRALPDKSASCISVHFHEYGLNDEEHWEKIANFLADNISLLMKTFKPLLDASPKN